MNRDVASLLEFLKLSERLKKEMRHSWLSNGRQESVAEHCWQMALMAMLCSRHLEQPVNLEKSLKMILIHDLVEAEAGDIPFFEKSARKDSKAHKEAEAIEQIKKMLPQEDGEEIYNLWHEFEASKTLEAKFVKALDNLEVQIQHNLADLDSWEEVEFGLVYTKMDTYCKHDGFLKQLCDQVKLEAEAKLESGGIDIRQVKVNASKSSPQPQN